MRWFRPTTAFVALALVFGLALAVLMPPTESFDERAHFLRAYQVSQLDWIPHRSGPLVGYGTFPSGLNRDLLRTFTDSLGNRDHTAFLDHLGDPQPGGRRVPTLMDSIAGYPPIAYVPAAAGITIGRVAGLSTLGLVYAARLADLLAFIALVWLALRRMPRHRWLLAIAGLVPVALLAAGTVTPDGVTYALVLLAIALGTRAAQQARGTLSRRDVVEMLLVAGALGLAKPPYALALLVYVPAMLRHRGGAARVVGAGVAFGVALMLLWSQLMSKPLSFYKLLVPGQVTDPYAPHTHVRPAAQLHYSLTHPWSFAAVVWRTTSLHKFDWMRDSVAQLTRARLIAPVPVAACWIAFVLAAIASERRSPTAPSSPSESSMSRAAMVTAVVLFIATLAGGYQTWNAYRSPIIREYQGRYLLAVVVLIFVAVAPLLSRLGAARPQLSTYAPPVALLLVSGALTWYAWVIVRTFYR